MESMEDNEGERGVMSEDYIKDRYDRALKDLIGELEAVGELLKDARHAAMQMSRSQGPGTMDAIIRFHEVRLGVVEILQNTVQSSLDRGGLITLETYQDIMTRSVVLKMDDMPLEGMANAFPDKVKATGKNCSKCGNPQYDTPHGLTCDKGHGGAPSKEEDTTADP